MKTQRKNFTRSAIARYWLDFQIKNKKLPPWDKSGWDPGEPACMACGWWQKSWDAGKTMTARWTSAIGLEKCHIVPLYLGGADELSNLVLMCGICHHAQPDSKDPQRTFNFMKDRTLLDRISGTALVTGFQALEAGKSVEEAARLALKKMQT